MAQPELAPLSGHRDHPYGRDQVGCLTGRNKGKEEGNEGGHGISEAPSMSQVLWWQGNSHVSFILTHPRSGRDSGGLSAGLRGDMPGLSGRAGCPARDEIQKGQGLPTIPVCLVAEPRMNSGLMEQLGC